MLDIATCLYKKPENMINLDLSYNSLYYDEHHPQEGRTDASEDFLTTFLEYLKLTKCLVHLNLSGLNFEPKELFVLCR